MDVLEDLRKTVVAQERRDRLVAEAIKAGHAAAVVATIARVSERRVRQIAQEHGLELPRGRPRKKIKEHMNDG
jgi:hypothetical protein